MVNKKQIRKEFDAAYKKGNKKAIKKLLKNHPWLMAEQVEVVDRSTEEQYQVIAALGVMEDDLGSPVPISEIHLSLREDFSFNKTEEHVENLLNEVKNLGLVESDGDDWHLTSKGGTICDAYLNKNLKDLEL